MAEAGRDCPGSWRPVPILQVGDVVICEVCGRRVGLTRPPVDYADDPSPDPKDRRAAVHCHGVRPPSRWFCATRAAPLRCNRNLHPHRDEARQPHR